MKVKPINRTVLSKEMTSARNKVEDGYHYTSFTTDLTLALLKESFIEEIS